jgi:hypothetical protein
VNLCLFGSLLEEVRQVSTFFAKDHLAFDDSTVTEKVSTLGKIQKQNSQDPCTAVVAQVAQVARSVKRKGVAGLL